MNSYNIRLAAVAVLFVLAAFTQTGCKETTIINAKVAPNIDHITVFDTTLQSLSRSIYDSNVNTSTYYGFPITLGCGVLSDPFFGITKSNIFFQIVPSNTNLTFTGMSIDSAVLVMPYSGFTAGDSANTSATQTYTVYRITDTTMKFNTLGGNYFAYSDKQIDLANPLSNAVTVNVHSLKDAINVDSVSAAPHLRIRLNDKFINAIKDSGSTTNHYSDFATFLSYFNGLCIQASNSNTAPAMPYFRLDESGDNTNYSKANVIIYYHTASSTSELTMSFPFLTSNCAFFNQISRNYTGAPAQQYILPYSAYSSNVNNDLLPLQNLPGASIDFKIYNIKSIPAASIINMAQVRLSVPTTSGSSSIFKAPSRVYIYTVNDTGAVSDPEDKQPNTSPYLAEFVDGKPYQINGVTTYTLNIPRTLQKAIRQGSDTLHLRISGTLDYYGAYGMVAAGGNYPDPNLRLKMYVIYTKQK